MKLLLTSGGLKTPALAEAMLELANIPAASLNVAFVPTAANVVDEDKCWLIDDLVALRQLGLARIDIVDPAALLPEQFAPRLELANVLVFGGGSTQFLLHSLRARGYVEELRELLATRVLVGISAGSVMCCPVINPRLVEGLRYVDFLFVPHKDAAFAARTKDDVQHFADLAGISTYWVDDRSALLVDGGSVKPVGTGIEVIKPQTSE